MGPAPFLKTDSGISGFTGDSNLLPADFPKLSATDPGKPFEQLFSELHAAIENKKRGRARRSEFKLWTKPDVSIFGWKFNEYDYGKASIELPTNARGLFSIVEDDKERIVVRGYDKFFNMNETPQTRWEWIEQHTQGPYEVTSKENGCIVFISGLADGTLIVTSKQSTGPRDSPIERNHSWVAQKWVERHLESKNVSVTDFAKILHHMGVTAVGELCDDDFEEHVLAYPGDKAGIYLHGLNLNVSKFTTYPFSSIEQFASQFGFHTTDYLVIDTLPELRSFLETCAETGSWKGVEVEGFVVRTKAQMNPEDKFPSDYFFKYKFEEPYLMYRQWREISRAYLSGKPRSEIRINKHIEISNRYLDFVIPLFNNDPALRESYNQSHGIISLRENFLKTLGKTGADILHDESSIEISSRTRRKKYVLVPISTIGCGKTTIAVALTRLFPKWGHFQNDDLTAGNKPQRLVQRCLDYLMLEDVVFFDRNNHQFRERAQIFTDFPKFAKFADDEYVFIALNFNPYESHASNTRDITSARILKRGDNHQSIFASSDSQAKIMGILDGFKSRFQPLQTSRQPDENFDFVIDLDTSTENSSRENLERIIIALHENYPEIVPETFSKEQLDTAFEFALAYKPKSTGPSKSHFEKQQKKVMKPSYFGLTIDFGLPLESQQAQIISLIDKFFEANRQVTPPSIWSKLKKTDRVQKAFHVTLVHVKQGGPKSTDEDARKVFAKYSEFFKAAPPVDPLPPAQPEKSADGFSTVSKKKRPVYGPVILEQSVDVALQNLAWTDDLMVFEVQLMDNDSTFGLTCINKVPHITIGTSDTSIPAVKAGEALAGKHDDCKLVKFPWNIEPRILKQQKLTAFP